jgi:hypothetical protein
MRETDAILPTGGHGGLRVAGLHVLASADAAGKREGEKFEERRKYLRHEHSEADGALNQDLGDLWATRLASGLLLLWKGV